MSINNYNIADIRDKVLRNKIIADQNRANIDKLINQIIAYKDSITDEQIRTLANYGIYLEQLRMVDTERLATDSNYLQEFIQYLKSTMDDYVRIIGGILNE